MEIFRLDGVKNCFCGEKFEGLLMRKCRLKLLRSLYLTLFSNFLVLCSVLQLKKV